MQTSFDDLNDVMAYVERLATLRLPVNVNRAVVELARIAGGLDAYLASVDASRSGSTPEELKDTIIGVSGRVREVLDALLSTYPTKVEINQKVW